MPNRLLKEGIVDSSAIDNLTSDEEVFFYRLLVVADDYGRMDARPAILKSRCYPLKNFPKYAEKIDGMLRSLVRQSLVICYQVDGKPYLQISKWEQRVRSKEKYPSVECGQLSDICQTDDGHMTDECQSIDGLGRGLGLGKGLGKGKGNGGVADATKPTRFPKDFQMTEEWHSFCVNERPDLNPQKTFDDFKDFWISKAKDNTKLDWLATWRGWVRRQHKQQKTTVDRNSDVMLGLTRGLIGGGNNVELLGS